jgi:general transcription factor IIIA
MIDFDTEWKKSARCDQIIFLCRSAPYKTAMKRKSSSEDTSDFDFEDEQESEPSAEPGTPITAPQTPSSTGRKTLQCPHQDCTKSFNRQARLTEHIRSHTNERPFKCIRDQCDKAFLRDSHLKHHIKSAHTDERDYACTWSNCDKKFATGTRLRRHEASHETKEKYTCKGYEGCNETFRKHVTLSRHILAVHENKKPFPCTHNDPETEKQCTLGFDTAEKLRSHQRAIHDQSRFVCIDCPITSDDMEAQISFATYSLLQNHIAELHPPTCPHCSLLCTSEKDLRRHLELAHDVISPFSDNADGATFPCTVPNCKRTFTKKGNLNVHIRTVHERRKDFVCGETAINLPVHQSQFEDEGLSPSQEVVGCGRDFTSKATLEEHIRTVHLGMSSKRQERNRKRQAEREIRGENMDEDGEGTKKKRRKTSSKKSAIAELSGSAVVGEPAGMEAEQGIGTPFDLPAYPLGQSGGFGYGFEQQPFTQQGYRPFYARDQLAEEELFATSSLGVSLDGMAAAASALVDPVLLQS